jgi:hypothetical protein
MLEPFSSLASSSIFSGDEVRVSWGDSGAWFNEGLGSLKLVKMAWGESRSPEFDWYC